MCSSAIPGFFRGLSEEAGTRGFPSLPFGGFGFFGVASDRIIAARWQLDSWSPTSALGHKQSFTSLSLERLVTAKSGRSWAAS